MSYIIIQTPPENANFKVLPVLNRQIDMGHMLEKLNLKTGLEFGYNYTFSENLLKTWPSCSAYHMFQLTDTNGKL